MTALRWFDAAELSDEMMENDVTVRIPLGNSGMFALIDACDESRVASRKWYLFVPRADNPALMYALCGKRKNHRPELLHRFILDSPEGFDIDHRNHNGLDCRRGNMRLASRGLNNANNRRKPGVSGYRGVYFKPEKKANPWLARLKSNNKYHHLGYYRTREEAARAYDKGAKKIHGEFATLNFPCSDV